MNEFFDSLSYNEASALVEQCYLADVREINSSNLHPLQKRVLIEELKRKKSKILELKDLETNYFKL